MCMDVNANESYSPPQKIIKTYLKCSTSNKNVCTKRLDCEESTNLEQFCNVHSELEENEGDFETVDESSYIKENNVNVITSKNKISTSEAHMNLSGECKAILRLILTKQNKIMQQNQIILAKIAALEKKSSTQISNCQLSYETKEKLCKTFILKTVNDLEEFDASLRKKTYFHEVIEYLRQKGGSDMRSHVFNILNTTISNFVATHYSYKEAVQMHTPSVTDDNIKNGIAAWLDNSSTRLKNESKNRVTNLIMEFEENDSN